MVRRDKTYFLMPPDVHLKFSGLINRAIALEIEPYRYSDVWDLMHALRKLKPQVSLGDAVEA